MFSWEGRFSFLEVGASYVQGSNLGLSVEWIFSTIYYALKLAASICNLSLKLESEVSHTLQQNKLKVWMKKWKNKCSFLDLEMFFL